MRLTPHEIAAIRECAAAHFGADAVVRLFGSRVRDDLRGGDIDLHITASEATVADREAEFRFKHALEGRIGEQRVDVLVGARSGPRRPIETIAIETGIVLPEPAGLGDEERTRRLPGRGSGSMLNSSYKDVLAEALHSGEATKLKLRRLMSELAPHIPLTADTLIARSWELELRTDSLLLQYTNMVAIVQDGMIRSILLAEAEPVARLSRLDQRHTIEKLGALPDGLALDRAANARNSIAHQYPDDAAYQAGMVNEVAEMTPTVIAAFDGLAEYARRRGHVPG